MVTRTRRPAPETAPPNDQKEPYHKGNVRAQLLAAAERILETESVEDVTARRLCREVGVTSANFYNHFPSLDFLLLEIAAASFERRARERERLLRRGLPREDAMVALAQNTVEFGMKHSQLFRIMFGEIKDTSINPAYVEKSDHGFGMLVELIYGEDLYRGDDLVWSHQHCPKAYAFMSFIWGMSYMFSRGLIANPGGTKASRLAFVEEMTRAYVEGLGDKARRSVTRAPVRKAP